MISIINKDKDFRCSDNTCEDVAHAAGHKLREAVDLALDETRDARDAVAKEIRSKPIQSGLIAAGVGFVLGFLLRRR